MDFREFINEKYTPDGDSPEDMFSDIWQIVKHMEKTIKGHDEEYNINKLMKKFKSDLSKHEDKLLNSIYDGE